jgi:hypothetical protein
MNKHLTIAEENFKLKMLAKASVKTHKEFTYKQTNGQTRKVVI